MPGRNAAAALRYNSRHQALRARLLARLVPGTPCPQVLIDGTVCGQPMYPSQPLDLGHAPGGGYLGLVHARCNRSTGSRLLALAQGKRLRGPQRPAAAGRPW